MAWTTPGTAVAGDVLTAAFWNEQVRDNMTHLYDTTGMVLLADASFGGGAASVIIDNVFSADYRNYRLITTFNIQNSAENIDMVLRSSAPADITGSYARQTLDVAHSTISGGRISGQNSWTAVGWAGFDSALSSAADPNSMIVDILNPFSSSRWTTIHTYTQGIPGGVDGVIRMLTGAHRSGTSAAGIKFLANTGGIGPGRYSVYGYNN
jgi:hypothetical protein